MRDPTQLVTRKNLERLFIAWRQPEVYPTKKKPRAYVHFPEGSEFRLLAIDFTGQKSTDGLLLFGLTFANP